MCSSWKLDSSATTTRPGVDRAGQVGQRPAHVAGHLDRPAGVAQDLAGELRGRRLAVRPGDRDPAVGQKPRRELDLAPDRHAAGERRGHDRRGVGHAGALDEQLDAFRQRRRRAEQKDRASRAQLGRRGAELRLVLLRRSRRARRAGSSRRASSAAARPDRPMPSTATERTPAIDSRHAPVLPVSSGPLAGHEFRPGRARSPRLARRRPARTRNWETCVATLWEWFPAWPREPCPRQASTSP